MNGLMILCSLIDKAATFFCMLEPCVLNVERFVRLIWYALIRFYPFRCALTRFPNRGLADSIYEYEKGGFSRCIQEQNLHSSLYLLLHYFQTTLFLRPTCTNYGKSSVSEVIADLAIL